MTSALDQHLRAVLATHFDPVHGSPYWLARERALGFDVREGVRCVADLARLGPFDLDDLNRHPVEHFLPRGVRDAGGLVFAETGGTSGEPRPIAYSRDDFHAAFVEPFIATLDAGLLPGGGRWLWLGPSGPHVIGRAAQCIARLTTGSDAFSVDFDPRWYRRLAPGSLARTRYLEHLLEQALRIVGRQDVRYLFCTPVVLAALAGRMDAAARARVRLVYLGGMPLAPDAMRAIGAAFTGARCLAGYGNTLFGVTHQPRWLAAGDPALAAPPRYLPASVRLVVRVVPPGDAPAALRLAGRAAPGVRGQVVMHRLDASGFLPNVMERDAAARIELDDEQDGLEDPRPIEQPAFKVDSGIY